jgi:hypothetical protein
MEVGKEGVINKQVHKEKDFCLYKKTYFSSLFY